ncbi:(d)CMP kinase [Marinoscillum pacificum]|uniref:(d)CMP kinase n=1 Tax=Marinoscillum pacificum TaxID=392723 RepID=UPI0021579EDE|nr:(d)CMP kinase [Marinoscillum pacificum]
MRKIVIALDGYSGTGKSSTAKEVAKALGYIYIDSGAMYRATTYYFLENQVDLADAKSVENALSNISISFSGNQVILNGDDISNDVRTMRINENVSAVSAIKEVRVAMVAQQQQIGQERGIVMDGRDIGTVVFPDAELKVFMTANPDVRAERRQKELAEKGIHEELNTIKVNLLDRDKIDSSRAESPLKKAEDAVEVDTSYLTFNEQVDKIVELAKGIIHAG